MGKQEKAIIIIGTSLSGWQIEQVKKAGYLIIYLKNIAREYIVRNADIVEEMDLNNEEEVIERCRKIAEMYDLRIVFSINEYRVPLAAKISEALALGGNHVSYEAAQNCKNKKQTREVLNKNFVSFTHYSLVQSLKEAEKAIESFEYPVIVKPANDSGSVHVYRCDNIYQVRHAVSSIKHNKNNWAGQPYDKDILIEEYFTGPEYSVESCTVGGITKIFSITEKMTTSNNLSIETGQNSPAVLDNYVSDEIKKVVIESLKALGVNNSTAHTELKATPKGVKIIEVNARPGHDRIHIITRVVTGYDMREIALHVAMGGNLEHLPRHEVLAETASSRFLLADRPGRIDYGELDKIKANPLVLELEMYAEKGAYVNECKSNFDRLGHFVVHGEKDRTSSQIADEIMSQLQFKVFE